MTVVPYVPPNDNDPFPRPRYQATATPALGTFFEAVVPGQIPVQLAGPGTPRSWTIDQCRDYACSSLCYHERRIVTDDGLVSFHFYPTEPPPIRSV